MFTLRQLLKGKKMADQTTGQPNGIRVFIEKSNIYTNKDDSKRAKYKGTINIVSHFNNPDLWEQVVKKLNGQELFGGTDLQSELIAILQGRLQLMERELEARGTEDRQRAQRAESEASIAKSDLIRAQQQVELLQAQLKMKTIEAEGYTNSLKQWADWYAATQPR